MEMGKGKRKGKEMPYQIIFPPACFGSSILTLPRELSNISWFNGLLLLSQRYFFILFYVVIAITITLTFE